MPYAHEYLVQACQNGDLDGVKRFLRHGWNPARATGNEWTCLEVAVYHGHEDIVEELLAWRSRGVLAWVDPRIRDNQVFRSACCHSSASIVKRLTLWRGPRHEYVDAAVWAGSCLLFALQRGGVFALTTVPMLLEWRDPQTGDGMPTFRIPHALAICVTDSQHQLVRALRPWAEPACPVHGFQQAMTRACELEDEGIVRELITWRPCLRWVDFDGLIPECVRLLQWGVFWELIYGLQIFIWRWPSRFRGQRCGPIVGLHWAPEIRTLVRKCLQVSRWSDRPIRRSWLAGLVPPSSL